MPQIFQPSTNTISRVALFGALVFVAGSLWLVNKVGRSPYVTRATVVTQQPVPFSHKLHVGGIGLDCRHCHTSVEEGAYAGMPSSKTCMTCHSQIFTHSAVLEPVRTSFEEDRSIEWARVHDLPDFAHFDHSAHVTKGVGCVTCHGRVDEMPLVRQVATLQMAWCLDCHRNPDRVLRSPDAVFLMDSDPLPNRPVKSDLDRDTTVRMLMNCTTCHQ